MTHLSQEELLGLDSCCASRRIFSMSPLWIEEDEGTCSSPPIKVSSFSGTTSKVCRVWLMPALAFIWSAAGVISRLVCTPWAPVFPFSSSSTQEPWQHKVQEGGGKEGKEGKLSLLCLSANKTAACIPHRNTPLSPLKWKQLTYIFLALLIMCIQIDWLCAAFMHTFLCATAPQTACTFPPSPPHTQKQGLCNLSWAAGFDEHRI